MRIIIILTGFLTLLTSSIFAMDHVKEVNIFSARHYDSDVQLYKKFTNKTGIKVNVVSGKDKALLKRIKSMAANSDYLFGLFLEFFLKKDNRHLCFVQ